MKILILGAGQVGSTLAKNLARDNENDITIIDTNQNQLNDIERYLDIKTIVGDASYASILESADIVNMDLIIAVTASDEKNMIACQTAHTLYNVGKKIARIRTSEYLHHKKLFSKNAIPIDFIITPEYLVTHFIIRMIEEPGASQVLEFENGLVQLVEARAFANTPIVNRPIKELHEHLPKTQMRIVYLFRNNKAITAEGSTIIEDGDEVYFLTKKKSITKVLKEFRRLDKPYRRIMIAGGGIVGLNLAKALEDKYHIHIIELNEKRIEKIADRLNHAVVLHGNASDEILLKEEGIEHTDLFLALTNSDETNVIVSILAKQLGAHKTVALVKRSIYDTLARQSADIDMVISPDQITAGGILSYIRKGDTMIVYSLRQGNSEALEIIAHGSQKNSQVIGRYIADINLPEGVVIGCVIRNNKVIMGSSSVIIEDGDHVLIALTDTSKIHEVEKLFKK